MSNVTIILGHFNTTLLVFDYPEFQEFLSNTLESRKFLMKSIGTEVDFWEKYTLDWAFNQPGSWGKGAFAGCILEEYNCWCIL